jgi:hypothetical protein
MKKLFINNTEITTDEEGRFSLNDLHAASGGEKKHQPNYFLALDSTSELERILNAEKTGFNAIVRKRGRYNGGTWVCRELVYSYAMWIKPEFNLKVIRTFDQIMSGQFAPITMQDMNELVKKIESDKHAASIGGSILSKYKIVKKENEEAFAQGIASVQMALGFK